MNLYYFNPNNYGEEFFVVTGSEQEAITCLNKHLVECDYPKKDWFTKEPLTWEDKYFSKYTIDVIPPGQVLTSEIS